MSFDLVVATGYLTVGALMLFLGFIILRENPRQRVNRAVSGMLVFGGLGPILGAYTNLTGQFPGTASGFRDVFSQFTFLWEFFFPCALLFALVFPVLHPWLRRWPRLGVLLFVPHVFHVLLVMLMSDSTNLFDRINPDSVPWGSSILGRGLGALLLSNPCNPMGKLVSGDDLAGWVGLGRRLDCSLIVDEFYSHYVWSLGTGEPGPTVSAARYVEDVDRDPVVILDGLTKNWRYPGWRTTWTIGPRKVIAAAESAGSFLDGGGSKPLQRAALEMLEPERVLADQRAIARVFRPKRDRMVERVSRMGLAIDREPDGTFYVFASLADLPEGLSDGMAFFRAALEKQVITVPGVFFDVNPGRRRARHLSRFHQHLRLSFGPPMEEIERGLDRLEEMVRDGR